MKLITLHLVNEQHTYGRTQKPKAIERTQNNATSQCDNIPTLWMPNPLDLPETQKPRAIYRAQNNSFKHQLSLRELGSGLMRQHAHGNTPRTLRWMNTPHEYGNAPRTLRCVTPHAHGNTPRTLRWMNTPACLRQYPENFEVCECTNMHMFWCTIVLCL